MLNKAVDTDLLVKNVAKQINTVISKEEKKERRVLTIRETELFLEQAQGTFYENLFILALETGLRVGELSALQWEDIDFAPFTLHTFRHTFATRAIECGMNPKTLQKLLGHGTLQMTMDLYCHVTEDTLFLEMEKFEKRCS